MWTGAGVAAGGGVRSGKSMESVAAAVLQDRYVLQCWRGLPAPPAAPARQRFWVCVMLCCCGSAADQLYGRQRPCCRQNCFGGRLLGDTAAVMSLCQPSQLAAAPHIPPPRRRGLAGDWCQAEVRAGRAGRRAGTVSCQSRRVITR